MLVQTNFEENYVFERKNRKKRKIFTDFFLFFNVSNFFVSRITQATNHRV